MMTEVEDVKTFKNPTEDWEHSGSFSIELTDGADTSIVPSGCYVARNFVSVQHGRIKQTAGGIEFYSYEKLFQWSYSCIKIIRNGHSRLLWVNRDYRGEN